MNAVTGALAAAVLSFIVGIGGLVVALRRDRVIEESGIASGRSTELNLALAGMTTLVANLQNDNRNLREEVGRLSKRLDLVIAECDQLATQLRSIRRKYGDDNGGSSS